MARENPWLFWPRFGWETLAKHGVLLGALARLAMWQMAIKRDPRSSRYMDQALTPVTDDEDETLDLLTKTTGAREAVSHIKKVEELTHAHAV